MPEPPPYISANTSITKELLSEFTKPARIDGLAAGRITFMNRLTPVSSNVAALSMVMIPVIVANNVAQTILYTTQNMEADNNVGDNNSTNGDNKADNNSCYL